jgi:hypothetical protein
VVVGLFVRCWVQCSSAREQTEEEMAKYIEEKYK